MAHLTFGTSFNEDLNLPLGLKYLKLNSNNQYFIDNLVNSIEELELDIYFNLELNNLPNNIIKLKFHRNSSYNKNLNSLTDTIEFIQLPKNYDKKIFHIPKSLKTIRCHYSYKFINDLKKKNIKIETY